MSLENGKDLSVEFRRWVADIGTEHAGEILGVSPRTVRRQMQNLREGKPLSQGTTDAFADWYKSQVSVECDGEGDAAETSDDLVSEDTSRAGTDSRRNDAAGLDELFEGPDQISVDERSYWRGLYERLPDVVPIVAYVDEDEYFGNEEAKELRRWRLYRQITEEDRLGRPMAAVPNRSQRLWYLRVRQMTLTLEIRLIDDRGLTLPPKRGQYDGLERREQIRQRRNELAELERTIRTVELQEKAYAVMGWPLRSLISLLIRPGSPKG